MNEIPFRPRFGVGIILALAGGLMLTQANGWGICLLTAGAGCILTEFARRRDIRRLVSTGNFVWAEITGCDTPWKVNHTYYCCFWAQRTAPDGTACRFQSDAVSFADVQDKTGWWVKVYLDENDLDRYYMDPECIRPEPEEN